MRGVPKNIRTGQDLYNIASTFDPVVALEVVMAHESLIPKAKYTALIKALKREQRLKRMKENAEFRHSERIEEINAELARLTEANEEAMTRVREIQGTITELTVERACLLDTLKSLPSGGSGRV